MRHQTLLVIIFLFSSLFYVDAQDEAYDIVIENGRVIDPETGLDDIRNVGIKGSQIVEITSEKIIGTKIIDAQGLVVSPGFIDPHVHGMTNDAHAYQVRDGVTTALELEGGIPFMKYWLESKKGKSIVNYGASVPHSFIRTAAMDDYGVFFEKSLQMIHEKGYGSPEQDKLIINMGRANYKALNPLEQERVNPLIKNELEQGALGIGVPVGYYPGSTHGEIFNVYKYAGEEQVPIFSHTRGFGMPGIQEAIANATTTGAPLHIVHANSLSLSEIDVTLDMVQSAQERGLDITTEVYPYTAASTSLESAIFDEGWQEKLSMTYNDIQWETTGERLTEENFDSFRKQGGVVILHMMKDEWIKRGLQHPVAMIGSDGMPYAPKAHPRTAGTFSRILGKYVRDEGTLSLPLAIKKMTLMPAQRLEKISPVMHRKGRIQIGADADITIFDPERIIDKADFKGLQYSVGVRHVIINGVPIVENGKIRENVYPGQAIVSKFKN